MLRIRRLFSDGILPSLRIALQTICAARVCPIRIDFVKRSPKITTGHVKPAARSDAPQAYNFKDSALCKKPSKYVRRFPHVLQVRRTAFSYFLKRRQSMIFDLFHLYSETGICCYSAVGTNPKRQLLYDDKPSPQAHAIRTDIQTILYIPNLIP